jgi:acyl phosphate:glycerol-3-phosphate acyltransferase
MLLTLAFMVAAYLIGSISFAVIVSRAMGLPSPHSYGSGNPGATNVLRTGSKKAAVLTLLGDAFKGGFALWLAQLIGRTWLQLPDNMAELTYAGVALAAFLGHLYPVYLGFRGGKGVATAAGILIVMNAGIGATVLGVWLLVALVARYSSLAAILAALVAPMAAVVTFGQSWFSVAVGCMAVLLVWRHRGNIAKLRAGTESRIRLKRRDAGSLPDGG